MLDLEVSWSPLLCPSLATSNDNPRAQLADADEKGHPSTCPPETAPTVRRTVTRMILPQTAIYALRAMASLANLGPGESLRSQELALRAHLPAHYVSKVMRRLVVAKLVSSQKGHGGGFRLAKAPSAITFTHILSAVDVELDQGRCILDSGECATQEPCVLHDSWNRLHEAIQTWANTSTLSDMRRAPALVAAAMPLPTETLIDMPTAAPATPTDLPGQPG